MSAKKPPSEKIGTIPPFGLRMPRELKERVEAAAAENANSLNSEIVFRLQASLESDDRQETESQERDDLWRQLQQHEAKIRTVEETAYGKEKLLNSEIAMLREALEEKRVTIAALERSAENREIALRIAVESSEQVTKELGERANFWKELVTTAEHGMRQYASLAKSICHQILAHGVDVPQPLSEMAEEMLPAFNWLKTDTTDELERSFLADPEKEVDESGQPANEDIGSNEPNARKGD